MTCGYVCPLCEGSGFLNNGEPCDYCITTVQVAPVAAGITENTIKDEDHTDQAL